MIIRACLIGLILVTAVLAETPAEIEARAARLRAAQAILNKDKAGKAGDMKAELTRLKAENARLRAQVAKLIAQVKALGGKVETATTPLARGAIPSFESLAKAFPTGVLPPVGQSPNDIYQDRIDSQGKKLKLVGKTIRVTFRAKEAASRVNSQGAIGKGFYLKGSPLKANWPAFSKPPSLSISGRGIHCDLECLISAKYIDQLADVKKGDLIILEGDIKKASHRVGDIWRAYSISLVNCKIIKIAHN